MADFFVLIFVDLCGGHFRVRGFSSQDNFIKHAVKGKYRMWYLHKEHMQDFRSFIGLVYQDYCMNLSKNNSDIGSALGTILNKRQLRDIRNAVLGIKTKENSLEEQWKELKKPIGD